MKLKDLWEYCSKNCPTEREKYKTMRVCIRMSKCRVWICDFLLLEASKELNLVGWTQFTRVDISSVATASRSAEP